MQTTISLNQGKQIPQKWILWLILLFVLGLITTMLTTEDQLENQKNRKYKTDKQQNTGKGSATDKTEIKIDADKKMHQVGDHFNKHGRSMGYTSKKEYGDAALRFAQDNSKNPKAQIFEGKWNGKGLTGNRQQYIISADNKSVIIDKLTGQIIDFYEGSEFKGLINIIKLQ